jgi:hypothetical protein
MSNEATNLVLECLRTVRTDVSGLREGVVDVKARLGRLELGFGQLIRDRADNFEGRAHL